MAKKEPEPIRVVLAEDCDEDAELAVMAMRRHGIRAEVVVVTTEAELDGALRAGTPDVVISDNSMVHMDGKTVYTISRKLAPGVPFIFLSGSVLRLAAGSEHVEGATACLDKSELESLGKVVARALASVARRVAEDDTE